MKTVDKVVRYLALTGAHSRSEISAATGMRLQTVCGAVAVARAKRRIAPAARRYDENTNRMVELLDIRNRQR